MTSFKKLKSVFPRF